ncbi:MAG: hypothetical protein ACOC8L_14660 [Spirochaetota bacterium]
MAKDRLIGSDGKIVTISKGSAYEGDNTQDLDELAGGSSGDGSGAGWYEVSSKAGSGSAIPSELGAGDLWWSDGTDVLANDDAVIPFTETEQSDVTSFNIEMSKAESDVTTLSDTVKRYRASGKVDWTGTLEGITELGVTDNEGWVINNFVRTIEQSSSGDVTVSEVDDSDIYLKGVIQKDVGAGETEAFIWVQIVLTSASLGASGEDAQSFTSNFRVATGGTEPTLYLRSIAD